MREILYKAQRSDTKEWIEGSLLVLDADSGYYFITEPYLSASTLPVRNLIYDHTHLVIPETICQFTGLYDKNGNKIWENDIVRKVDSNALGWHRERMCSVSFDKLGYWLLTTEYGDGYWLGEFESEQLEVISTIFDNPELLKGGYECTK